MQYVPPGTPADASMSVDLARMTHGRMTQRGNSNFHWLINLFQIPFILSLSKSYKLLLVWRPMHLTDALHF
jgi:hypothetical protein